MERKNTRNKISFRARVCETVKKIPFGDFLTYKQVAKLAGFPRAYRAVGNILNKNQNPEIPCHRVIRSDGKLGGYNRGADKKILFLKKEGVRISLEAKIENDTKTAPT
ncbi:MAG: MGMT family protein [Patescibacteria group bacterium]